MSVYISKNLEEYFNWLDFRFALNSHEFESSQGSLEVYMVVNFKTHGINRGTRKLIQILMLIQKKMHISNILMILLIFYDKTYILSRPKHKLKTISTK
jgi:hypothetical protein